MKCSKCSSEWNSTVKSELCPFCGNVLEKKKDFKTIDDVFSFVFSEYGIEIIREHRRFISVLSDYAPQMNKERNLIKIALECGVYSLIVDADKKDSAEQEICFKKGQSILEQQHFLSTSWAKKVLMWLTNYLEWNIKPETSDNLNFYSINNIQRGLTPEIESYIKRMFMFLNDGEWQKADEYCEKVLDINPECAEAYLGKLMVNLKIKTVSGFDNEKSNFKTNKNYQKIITFGDVNIKKRLKDNLDRIELGISELMARRIEIAKVQNVIFANDSHCVGLCSDGKVVATGLNEYGQCNVSSWADVLDISLGRYCTVGVCADGKVIVTGYSESNVFSFGEWSDIVASKIAYSHAIGLRADGKVVATGSNLFNQCRVNHWRDVIAISVGTFHSVSLHSNGNVGAIGHNEYGQCDVCYWSDIVAISAGNYHTVGLRSDGKVVATGKNECGECNVSDWTDIIAITTGNALTIGLRSDGKVVAVGANKFGECNVSDWTDIVAIATSDYHTVGLYSDGKVVAVGSNEYCQCNVADWSDIVAISAGFGFTVGLRSDGKVVAVGDNKLGQCNVNGWKLFDSFDNFEEERKNKMDEDRKIRDEKKHIIEETISRRRSRNLCQYCGGTFKGLLTKKCSTCGKIKDY